MRPLAPVLILDYTTTLWVSSPATIPHLPTDRYGPVSVAEIGTRIWRPASNKPSSKIGDYAVDPQQGSV